MKQVIRPLKIILGAAVVGVALTGCGLQPAGTPGAAPTPIAVAVAGDAKDPTAAPTAAAPTAAAPTAAAPTAAAPALPAAAPSRQEYDEIGLAVLAYLSGEGLGQPAVVGAAATAGDYAVALAGVFLEETGSRYIFLKREPAGGWLVRYDSPRPTAEALAERGIPASLGADFPVYGLHQAVINQLNDPRGPAGNTYVVVEAMDQGFAKVYAVPDDRTMRDTPTIYYGPGEAGTYRYLIAGTAFMPADLDQFGIPQSVR